MLDAWVLSAILAGQVPAAIPNPPQVIVTDPPERCAVPLLDVTPRGKFREHNRFRFRVRPPEPMPSIVPLPSCKDRPGDRRWYPGRETPLPGPNPR